MAHVHFGPGTTITHTPNPKGDPPFTAPPYASHINSAGTMVMDVDPTHGPYEWDEDQRLYRWPYSPGNWFYRIYYSDGTYKVFHGTTEIESGRFTAVA